jgi:hexosaminidase
MRKIFILPLAALLLYSCGGPSPMPDIIPLPSEIKMEKGSFGINGRTRIVYLDDIPEVKWVAEGIANRLGSLTGSTPEVKGRQGKPPRNSIALDIDPSLESTLGKEGYKLEVTSSRIMIRAGAPAGLFYGMQTVYQSMPPEVFGTSGNLDLKVPCMKVTDKPSFGWRGMHLDVSRHFFPKEFIKKYIDLIAMHKMNVFHWHLTDDNGWRIEIEKYPLLTDVAAWRVDREGQSWTQRAPAREGEPATYGGFYSREDIREIVEYAQKRFVTIVPEIEMPGHSSEVFSAYPQYSCTGERIPVQAGSYWPNSDVFCAGNDETFSFLEDILNEVMEMFPGDYIHVGGDEVDKTNWKSCPKCQARIRNQGLEDVDELQSYFMKRMEKFINSKGRKLIGWDEILEGGLPPEATVMSWRGFEGGIAAAVQGHEVVMCPSSHCYFDHYQADPDFQPEAIGGLTTLRKVYSLQPVPSELSPEQARLILGAQGNLWTEYVADSKHAEYMVLPRMSALAEVLWTPESRREWYDFRERLQAQFRRFEKMNANYFEGSGKVNVVPQFNQDGTPVSFKLETEAYDTDIHYTLDGLEPGLRTFPYKNPIPLSQSVTIKAIAFKNGKKMEKVSVQPFIFHEALGKPLKFTNDYNERYPAGGAGALVDGLSGTLYFNDGLWQGFYGQDMEVTIDLGENANVKLLSANFLLDQRKWIFLPEKVNFYFSLDGEKYTLLAGRSHEIDQKGEVPMTNEFRINLERPFPARYIRIQAKNIGVCPDWHPASGGRAWIFADEITINPKY